VFPRKRVPLIVPLDVFALRNGEPKRIGCADTLAQALQLIGETGQGTYLVFSQMTKNKILYTVKSDGRVSRLAEP
jgi:hypothetical protein